MPASAYESRKNPVQVFIFTGRDSYASEKRLGVLSKLRKKLESRGAGFVEGKDLESLDMRFALLGNSGIASARKRGWRIFGFA
jgi:hypothetical protein